MVLSEGLSSAREGAPRKQPRRRT